MIELLRSLYRRLTAGGSTTEQAVQSGIWVAGINVGDRILQMLKVVILARLLSPEAFGLLGIALLVITALRQFSRLGFDEALIQHENEDVDAYLDTAWVMKIIRGLVITAVAFLAAPYLAVIFGEPQAEPLIRVAGITALILGLQNPAVMYFQKGLNFHREFAYQVGGRLVDLIVATAVALAYRSVWALIAGIIAMNLIKFILSYFIHEYRPSIGFNIKYANEMFGFGKWMFVSAILVFLYGQGDDAFVGWFFAAGTLGIYQIAYRFSNAPATEVTHVISRVAFPALSKVQDDPEKLRKGFLRTIQLSVTVAFPMAAGIVAVAPQFVPVFLGDQWSPAISVMQILAVWGGIRAFGANVGPVYKSVGRPDLEARIQALKVLILMITIYPAARAFGVDGVAAVIVANSFFILPIHLYYVLPIIQTRLSDVLKLIVYPFVSCVVMAISVRTLNFYIGLDASILNLALLILAGAATYSILMIIFENLSSCEFTELLYIVKQSI